MAAKDEKKAKKGKMYVWSEIWDGGDVEQIKTASGNTRNIVSNRKVHKLGDEVSPGDLSDEDWDTMVAGGTLRPYPVPEGVDEGTSPTQVVVAKLYEGGDVDQDQLLEMALYHPPALNPPSEEAAEVDVPEGA